jgi:hypothetical protein
MTERQRKQVDEFVASLPAMTDAELTEATKQYVWLSAYAANNPRSAYHPMCDATYDEWVRRDNPDGYSESHRAVSEANAR